MNKGERAELLVQLSLVSMRDLGLSLGNLKVVSVGFSNEYGKIPNDDLEEIKKGNFIYHEMDDSSLAKFCKTIGISKAATGAKADVYINKIGYSLKSNNAAPPAIVNHTARPGFVNVFQRINKNIQGLDKIIDEYWKLRLSGQIGEDIPNSNPLSPFKNHKEYLRPIINYFLFTGTGSKVSEHQAEYILAFGNPNLINKDYKVYNESDAINLFWDKMFFSLRSKKGMNKFPNLSKKQMPLFDSYQRWTKEPEKGKYKGALHIRVSK